MKETFVCFSVVFFGSRLIMASDTITVNCSETVVGQYGSSVVLPCWLTPETNAETLEIRWYRPGQFKSPLLFYQNRKLVTEIQQSYINRSSLSKRNCQSAGLKQGDVSLRLDTLDLSDLGSFHCYVSGDRSYHDNTVKLSLTALGSSPHLSLEDHRDSVNLSCSSCGWFPKPRLLWKFASEKEDSLSDPQSPIYNIQKNGLFCIYNWVILSSSVSNKITCSVFLSEDEKRDVNLDLGAQLSDDSRGVWKVLFTLALLCLLALIGFLLYRKFKREYKPVSTDDPDPHPATIMTELRAAAVPVIFNMDSCKRDHLQFNKEGNIVRDAETSHVYKGLGFPYELCVQGREKLRPGRSYWEVGLNQPNTPPKQSWLIGVAKASYTTSDKKSHFTPSNGFWFLCSEPEKGLRVNTEPEISLQVNTALERVGVLVDSDTKELAFYNATDGVRLFTMRMDFHEEIVPLFNPGIGDIAPLKLFNQVQAENEPGRSASAQAGDSKQHV